MLNEPVWQSPEETAFWAKVEADLQAPEHQLHYMEQWGWDVCAGDEYCLHPTTYNCITCKKLFCVIHGQAHGTILLY